MKKFLYAITIFLALSACSKKDDPEPTPEPPVTVDQRTVLVYMAGENNLGTQAYLAADYDELLEGSYLLNSNQHLLAFIDSCGKDNTPHIVEIVDGKAKEVYRYTEEFSSADPDKLREVMQWAIDNYPAQDYGLVLWGHASGWAISTDSIAKARRDNRAYGQDKGSDMTWGSEKWMNLPQMARSLEQLPHLKFIFADCCCFQCLESAYELRKVADYLIGSPAEIPGEGAPYQKMVAKLFSTSNTFYKEICDCYYDFFIDAYQSSPTYTSESWAAYLQGYSVPLSTIDLSQMDALAEATAKLMKSFIPQSPAELNLDGLPFYFGYANNMVMYDTKSVLKTYAPASDYAKWLTAYNKAVPYQLVSRKWQTIYNVILNRFDNFPTDNDMYGCTSMLFPQASYSTATYRYNECIRQMQWYSAVDWASYGW